MWLVPGAACLPLRAEEPVAPIGTQLAARSAIPWEANDVDHPQLGPIRFAVQKPAIATASPVGKILSQSFVSCQKGTGKLAIELTNAPESDLAGGLRPMERPRLVCSRPAPGGKGKPVRSDLVVKWEIGPLGDTLARGLAPAELRRCTSIRVIQKVALPAGTSATGQRIAFDILPSHPALDSVFAACGATAAAAPEAQAAAEAAWRPARTTTKGRTVVRAAASVDSPMVAMLAPGTKLLVQRHAAPWWKVKPRSGTGFGGYIREDRLAFD